MDKTFQLTLVIRLEVILPDVPEQVNNAAGLEVAMRHSALSITGKLPHDVRLIFGGFRELLELEEYRLHVRTIAIIEGES